VLLHCFTSKGGTKSQNATFQIYVGAEIKPIRVTWRYRMGSILNALLDKYKAGTRGRNLFGSRIVRNKWLPRKNVISVTWNNETCQKQRVCCVRRETHRQIACCVIYVLTRWWLWGGGDICSKHWHVVVVITSPQLRALLISRRVPSGNVYNFSEPVKTKSAESILKKFVWNALRPK